MDGLHQSLTHDKQQHQEVEHDKDCKDRVDSAVEPSQTPGGLFTVLIRYSLKEFDNERTDEAPSEAELSHDRNHVVLRPTIRAKDEDNCLPHDADGQRDEQTNQRAVSWDEENEARQG